MHHSIDRRRIVGEENALSRCILYSNFMHSYTMFLEAVNPRRSVIYFQSHGKYVATTIVLLGHSLGGKREILFHDGCFPKVPNISHTFSYSEMAWAASKWWENHLPHLGLMQQEMHYVGSTCGTMTHLHMCNFLFVCTLFCSHSLMTCLYFLWEYMEGG